MLTCGACASIKEPETKTDEQKPGAAILLVDTDRIVSDVSEDIYGQFLEHINHSVIDGLYAEQIQGQGFEGEDFESYWKKYERQGKVSLVTTPFENGEQSVKLEVSDGAAAILQGRINIEKGHSYNGSFWVKPEAKSPNLLIRLRDSSRKIIDELRLVMKGNDWQEIPFTFNATLTDSLCTVEIEAEGTGAVLLDFISLMRADVRERGMFRPDLLKSLDDLKPSFIRWPGGSFASDYKWKDGIGPHVSRKYHPNEMWGGYADYYGFGTDEFLELCKQLEADPMIVLSATSTDSEQVQYAMDWVHYLIDPPGTEWGALRAANGHPEPYDVPYFQIDNEPMNHGLSPDEYAVIVNVYGQRLREIAPDAKIVACGQKRSNDMIWSQKMVDIAGQNFDILGCHNYEYEPENFQTGVRRINDYLVKLRDYVRTSSHPDIKIAVLEWGLCRSYDWRAGLHAAGLLISFEQHGRELEMSCPALLMRNTEDDPTWTAFIYHDQKSWFPGGGYVVEKLFREHYASKYLASTSGTFRMLENGGLFFDDISQMKPEDWEPHTVDAIATTNTDGSKIVIKAVNYTDHEQILLTRLQGAGLTQNASVKTYTLTADLSEKASLDQPNKILPKEGTLPYKSDLKIELKPYSVMVVEVVSEP